MRDFSSEFLQEAMEKLETFRCLILQIESSGTKPELLNEAFRAIHTIKGSGAMVGFEHLAKSVHELETELDQFRKLKIDNDLHNVVDRFLQWSDYIETYLKGLATDPEFTINFDASNNASHAFTATIGYSESPQIAETPFFSSEVDNSSVVKDETRNFPIHYLSYLQSSRSVSSEMAWSLLSMSALNLPNLEEENFASTALQLLRTHCDLSEITRVCLVRRLGLSNQFESVSSAAISKNFMLKGTRCFVHPKSSLTKIAPGYVRIINFPEVLKSYSNAKQRPQRVVNILSELDYKSGICIGIGAKQQNLGYLFLNAGTNMLLDIPSQSLPIINELARYATSHLQNHANLELIYCKIWPKDHEHLIGRRLQFDALNSAFSRAGDVMGTAPLVQNKTSEKLPPALVSHANIAYLLARLASIRGTRSCEVGIKIDRGRLVFSGNLIGLDTELHPAFLATSHTVANSLGYLFESYDKNSFTLSTALDLCLDMNTQYSV